MTGGDISVTTHQSIAEISAADWDRCANPGGGRPLDPFTTHRFLMALELSGSVGPGTGWQPLYLSVRRATDLIAVAPLYAKAHSQGEYIFDHGWADAYARAGGSYYPKLQIAAPFTPATGRRFLCLPGHETEGESAIIAAAKSLAAENTLSSFHITFCTLAEAERATGAGMLHRVTQQFHWRNQNYRDFGEFLAELSSRKRKAIRKERARAAAFGGDIVLLTGDELRPAHWDAFWQFYQDTGARKWGTPYLTRSFFDLVHETMADDMLLALAVRGGNFVAGALNFIGRDTLYGRYWGAIEDHPYLHFELCYYQAMDWAIEHGLSRVEAGAQGEHKLARGYLPAEVHSLHWMREPAFHEAVARYLEAERNAVGEEIEILTDYGPFRKGP